MQLQLDSSVILGIIGAIMMLLLAGNLFFIRGLISKLEKTATTAADAKSTGNTLLGVLREIKADVKALAKVETEVAVIKSHLGLGGLGRRRKAAEFNGEHDEDESA